MESRFLYTSPVPPKPKPAPTYERQPTHPWMLVCSECGALVDLSDHEKHTAFHARNK